MRSRTSRLRMSGNRARKSDNSIVCKPCWRGPGATFASVSAFPPSATAMLSPKFGRGVNFDSARLKDCLYRNQDSMSAQCKADYSGAFEAIQKRVAARAAVPKMCQREIAKLCGGAQKEVSRYLECLMTTSGVSARCNQAIGDAGYR